MFSEIFARTLRAIAQKPLVFSPPNTCHTRAPRLCTLCHASRISYDDEVRARNAALQEYWRALKLPCSLAPLVPSPRGRHYRTVSKRKVFRNRGEVRLGLIDPGKSAPGHLADVDHCMIEPEFHGAVYAHLSRALGQPSAGRIGAGLRYVVIKGDYRHGIVILSLEHMRGVGTGEINALSKALTRACPEVRGVLLFEGAGGERYYLGTSDPDSRATTRRVYGQSELRQRFGGKEFLFPAFSFSQVNASLLDGMIEEVKRMAAASAHSVLYDLYCGYGVFTLTVGSGAARAVGIDRARESIDAASANAKRQGAASVRFARAALSGEGLPAVLPQLRAEDAVLLDPPRGGTAAGVIECVAARRPGRAVHLFCNIERMSEEIARWERCAYRPSRAVPFDMFPGTDDTEIMILFVPA